MSEITYHKEGDYFIPDLYLEKEDYEKDYIIGKYGHLRLEYLKTHMWLASCIHQAALIWSVAASIALYLCCPPLRRLMKVPRPPEPCMGFCPS